MKKFWMLLVPLCLLIAAPSFAAWTVTVTQDRVADWDGGQRMYVYKFVCTSDASGSGDITLSTELVTTYGASRGAMILRDGVAGGMLYAVKYKPDGTATPTSESTITIDDETGALIFSEAVTTAATPQVFDGTVDSGFAVPVLDVVLAATSLANAKVANIYVWILK